MNDRMYAIFISPWHQCIILHYLLISKLMLWEYLQNVAKVLKEVKVTVERQKKEYIQTALLSTTKQPEGYSDEDTSSSSSQELQGTGYGVVTCYTVKSGA